MGFSSIDKFGEKQTKSAFYFNLELHILQISDLRHTTNGHEGLQSEYTWERLLKHGNQIINSARPRLPGKY